MNSSSTFSFEKTINNAPINKIEQTNSSKKSCFIKVKYKLFDTIGVLMKAKLVILKDKRFSMNLALINSKIPTIKLGTNKIQPTF
jgi:hypothetical protein